MMRAMKFMLAPLERRVQLMVNRAVVALVDDSQKMQLVQVQLLADSARDGVERFQNYGLTSYPHPGAEAVAVSVMGNQDHAIVIAVDDRRYRLVGLKEGEVALYDDLGQQVHLTRSGIVIDGAGLPVTIQNAPTVKVDTPTCHFTGNVTVDGKVMVTGDVSAMAGTIAMTGIKATYNGHTHLDPQGGATAAPTQVI